MSTFRIGIDLGGTKIELIVMAPNNQVIYKQRIPTPPGNYQKTLTDIHSLILNAEQQVQQICSIGIGTPGAISKKTGRLKNSNSTCLNDQPFHHDLEAILSQKNKRKIRISNDANCFALSESSDGAAQGSNNVFGVIIGTGTGAGIVINQKIVEGANSIGGEWGHNPLPWANENESIKPTCYCGKQGCIETYLSGPGLEADYLRTFHKKLSTYEIIKGAVNNDKTCEATLQRYENRLARALSHVINILDPDIIVLGGGMSNMMRLYENVPKIWGEYIFSDHVLTQLKPPIHGDSSGVRGAARLWDT